MAKPIMIQGTMSNSGKSFLVTGLCRIFRNDGYNVAPFKSQNMALNSYITDEGLEIGRAQAAQAEASKMIPDVRINPILLKPTGDKTSQVIVNGKSIGNMEAKKYFKYRISLKNEIEKAYESLSKENDIIVIEGAGSPAEINLKENDIVNMGMAEIAKSPVIIAGDIDRGGVFASLYGTVMLLDEKYKNYVKGFIINKFRGDVSLLQNGLDMMYEKLHIPFIGVVPFFKDVYIDDEDILSVRLKNAENKSLIDIAIICLPHISNFNDFYPLDHIPNASVRYITKSFGNPDLIIIPGTKNTIDDFKWLKEKGLDKKIIEHAKKYKPVIGICGGYQMLSRSIYDPLNLEGGGYTRGLSLLNSEIVFEKEKTQSKITGVFENIEGLFSKLNGKKFYGYEIHMGKTNVLDKNISSIYLNDGSIKKDGLCKNNILGTYVHGIFDSPDILNAIKETLYELKGIEKDPETFKIFDIKEYKELQYEKLAKNLRENLNMKMIYDIIEKGI